ncbi:D12 class N6 adenine-specific DNA methyltransferase [Corynebacterium glaucum]|uniref:DNA adenine methylase n=1 Tax=Corynebacterium glaucum TaxID=187491 RepID=UPI0025B58FF8|nr:DNA adenine methylase [Corynebacterium glaucum]WJZ08850.1 D12 class N6 adenine-specific DNA methyltransferase [Corynebacterium glaucum]
MRYLSPLRYPGGKARLAPFLERIIESQLPIPTHYAEPFAGGAGAALQLLHRGVVSKIHLNDLNPGIAAMWRAILDECCAFVQLIKTTPLDVNEWERQRDIYRNPIGRDDVELGFATFYLNRTNRSGILHAGPIGGHAQHGKWKLDARFNRATLVKRVETVATMREHIIVTELDGLDFLDGLRDFGEDLFVYADPPYMVQGDGLYLHAFDEMAHIGLANKLQSISSPWLLTYDDDPRITEVLYRDGRCATFQIAHTAHKQHIGSEAIIFSEDLTLPDLEVTSGRQALWAN